MFKRYWKIARAALWVAFLAIGCLSAAMFVRKDQAVQQAASTSIQHEPEATGSIKPVPTKWCGAAPWCR